MLCNKTNAGTKSHIFCKYSGHTREAGLENSLTFPVSKVKIVTRVREMMIKPFLDFAIPTKKWREGTKKNKRN